MIWESGYWKEELYKIDFKNNVERLIFPAKKSLKIEMKKLIDEYYNMEKVELTEDLSDEELKIIKFRLEALGYLNKKEKK